MTGICDKKTEIINRKCKVLHFAPEKNLFRLFSSSDNVDHYPCDLNQKDNWLKIDITNIPFSGDYFDFVISNHVLEHVVDEKKQSVK